MDNVKIYYELKRGDRSYELNMPELQAMMFLTLFDDSNWSWVGLAKLLKARFVESDIDDLVYQLKEDDLKYDPRSAIKGIGLYEDPIGTGSAGWIKTSDGLYFIGLDGKIAKPNM